MSVQQLLQELGQAGQAAAATSDEGDRAVAITEAGSLQLGDVQALQKIAQSQRSASLWASSSHSASEIGR